MSRLHQTLLICATLGTSWLGMMVVHEAGHVLMAWLSGGTVTKVVLGPLLISRTDVDPNPHPLWEIWGGPVGGCLIPLILWSLARWRRVSWTYLAAFFAGFCLIANGCYLGIGSFDRVGDAGDLLKQGAPAWQLILFGIITIVPGLWLWHGLGPHFGWGTARGRVNEAHAVALSVLFVLLVLIESLFFGETGAIF